MLFFTRRVKAYVLLAANNRLYVFRIGVITARIWERRVEKDQFYSVSFERRWKDAAGQYQTTHNYAAQNLLALAKAADLAHTRIIELAD